MTLQIINRQRIASFFVIVFFGIMLMKPVHFLFADHHSIYLTHTHTEGKAASIHQDCDICLFMLHAFTPQQFAELQEHFDTYFTEIIQADIQAWIYKLPFQISLRAPPMVSFS